MDHVDVPNPKRAKERADLYEDDLTDECRITPAERDDVARTQVLDPDILDTGTPAVP